MEIKDELLDIEGIKKSNKNLLDLFIRRTAVLTSTQESLCEKIIKDQWKNANKMTQQDYQISELDFANLGTFFISKAKARKRLARIDKYTEVESVKGDGPDVKLNSKRQAILLSARETKKTILFKTKQISSRYEI